MKTTFPASICPILLLGAAQPAWSAAAKTADRWLVLSQSAGALTLRSLRIEGT